MKKSSLLIACTLAAYTLGAQADIKIGGNNKQSVKVENGAVVNMANGGLATAKQNLASNKGNVKIGGTNQQSVDVKNGAVVNMANGGLTKAEQNLASNDGTK